MINKNILICPICKRELNKEGHSFLCESKHCFDVAKEGYVNLLMCNKKKSKFPGDDKIMALARNKFLQRGYFNRLRERIESLIREKAPYYILDAGCGTGFYTQNLQDEFNIISVDISKEAVKYAAKSNKKSLVVVSSIFDIPIKDKSMQVILNVFAPKPLEEFARVLDDNGIIIEVVPGKDHLKELKEEIFDKDNESNKEKFAFNNFNLKSSKRLRYVAEIDKTEDLIHLLEMTPYFYKGGDKQISKISAIKNLDVTLDFIINVWEGI